jgi:hypothetical protein
MTHRDIGQLLTQPTSFQRVWDRGGYQWFAKTNARSAPSPVTARNSTSTKSFGCILALMRATMRLKRSLRMNAADVRRRPSGRFYLRRKDMSL